MGCEKYAIVLVEVELTLIAFNFETLRPSITSKDFHHLMENNGIYIWELNANIAQISIQSLKILDPCFEHQFK